MSAHIKTWQERSWAYDTPPDCLEPEDHTKQMLAEIAELRAVAPAHDCPRQTPYGEAICGKCMEAAAPVDERAAFEKAMNDARFFPRELNFSRGHGRSGRDEYFNAHLQSCWVGWQARAAFAHPVAALPAFDAGPIVEGVKLACCKDSAGLVCLGSGFCPRAATARPAAKRTRILHDAFEALQAAEDQRDRRQLADRRAAPFLDTPRSGDMAQVVDAEVDDMHFLGM